jgi:hypothetical protein
MAPIDFGTWPYDPEMVDEWHLMLDGVVQRNDLVMHVLSALSSTN